MMGGPIAPTPQRAQVQLAGLRLLVDFDLPLQAGVLNAGNWGWDYSFSRFVGADATAAGLRVTVNGTNIGFGGAVNLCTFSPPPDDVVTFCGGVAKAFADFPIG